MTSPETGDVVARLRAAGSVFAEDEAVVLIAAADTGDALASMVSRRVLGEPLEVIVGWAEFCGVRVEVDRGVFVPRTRTGILVDEGARLIGAGSLVVDLCCGTGAVGVALHARQPDIVLVASDIEPAAVRCARRNVEPRGGQVFAGDLFAAVPDVLRHLVDLLVVNAPYVPTGAIATMPPEARDHEPLVALDGGPDGVALHRLVAAEARQWLAPGGHLLIETSRGQAELTADAVRAGGLVARIVMSDDLDGTAVIGALEPNVRGA